MWTSILSSSIVMIAFLLIFAVVYYVLGMRGVKKQKDHFVHLHESLKPGQDVVFSNGMHGKIKEINSGETVDIQVKSGAVIEVSRYAISEIIQ